MKTNLVPENRPKRFGLHPNKNWPVSSLMAFRSSGESADGLKMSHGMILEGYRKSDGTERRQDEARCWWSV